jgi:hypothetical protein
MNHQRVYDALIERARNRKLTGYSERHHVVPRCMGGGDEEANLVRLTPEEHFVVHQLLVHIHPDVPKLVFALLALSMCVGERMNNKLFGWMRRRIAQEISRRKTGVPRDRAMMERIWAGNRGRKAPAHEIEKMRHGLKGRPHSPEHNAKVGRKGRVSPMKGRQHSEETKAKQRAAALKRRHTEETKAKLTAFAAALTPEQRSARAYKAWQTKRTKVAHD